jgi:hypothetical protein
MNARSSIPFEAVPEYLTVESRCWIQDDENAPPRIEARLSNGSYVLVGWDSDYSHAVVFVAADKHSEFVSGVAAESGLDPDVLYGLVTEAQAATEAHESNQRAEYMADADSYADGREE